MLKESEQIRRENHSSGPQDELEYWKKRGARFSQIVNQVNSPEVQLTICCIKMAHSKLFKEWLETDKKITFCYNEAKDNAKYIQALESKCHSLYLDDPVKMRKSILGLLQTVRLIHSVSQFYNTSERTSALMVKITNQMIQTCKDYITCRGQESIWSQDRAVMKDKLTQCIILNKVYRRTYIFVKNQTVIPGQPPFNFSENYVFGKFDGFCRRIMKIISMFELIDDYTGLFQRRMEGLLLGEALDDAISKFTEIRQIVMNKPYDYLDARNAEFENDFKKFLSHTDELKETIADTIERNFDSVWETPQGIRFLTRFEKVSEKIPLAKMSEKYDRILRYCEREVERIVKMFKNKRMILQYLGCSHLLQVSEVDHCLLRHLIAVNAEKQKLKVNLHPAIPLLIREAEIMIKMDLPLPIVALTLYAKNEYFWDVKDSIQFLINDLLSVVKEVKLEVRPLLLPHLVKLTSIIEPGLTKLNWVSLNWKEFVDKGNEAVQNFKILTERVHDVYVNRVLEVLRSMQMIQLHTLPESDEDPWTVEFFCSKIEAVCRTAAIELHKKSLMVEEAVEEILSLVKRIDIAPEGATTEDGFTFEDQSAGEPATSSSQQQQSDWSLVWECFDKPHILLSGGMAKTMQDAVKSAVGDMRRYYSRKIVDVLVRVTRTSLDALRRRFAMELDLVRCSAMRCICFFLEATPHKRSAWRKLAGHKSNLAEIVNNSRLYQKPTVTASAKGQGQVRTQEEDFKMRRRKLYRLMSEERPKFPLQQRNFYNHVMENKEVEVTQFIVRWRPYSMLWKNEKTQRELLNACLTEFEMSLRKHAELTERIATEPNTFDIANCLAISTDQLKYGLLTEIKACTYRIGQAMKKKYRREMDYVYAVISDMERKLDRNIRDLDDVRMIMDTLKRIREQETDMELKIEPIEEAFNVLQRFEVFVESEITEQVDNLRYTWSQLLGRAMKMQNRFDGMWRKLQTYQSGEELFGLPTTDYPELAQIRKELNLLQKLYKLYNDVIDRVNSYYDIPWGEVNIEEINNELMEFQNRCRKLPKGLKEWPAFFALKKTIDDFNDMCPLLELMANRAMKPRHWQRIMDSLNYIFEFESDGFSLKNILEAPLLQYKEDIEDICISAMKEKDIEAKLRQVTNEWTVHELTFMTFNNRGELLLRGDTTAETIGQLEDSLMVLGSLLSNRYNAPFKKQIQQWVHDLSNTNEILERWLLVQNMWVYLEAVFVGGDIAKQLPKEAKRFSRIDKAWQKIMQRAHETPGVVACCVGEVIQLEKAVRAEGSVETWLTQLLTTAQTSLHSIIRQAYVMINDTNFHMLQFLDKMPAQVGLLGIQMIWTRDAELALLQARHDKKVMPDTNNKFLELLNTLIDQTTRDLTKIERIKFETLITIHVHQRDIFDILVRLAQSGSWGCFDEFNRIELPVLSVAAQQVAVVLAAKKEKKKSFQFTDGDIIELNPEFGIFITMNPGYAGRKELPENLKIQFRTVAMMVPDRQIIIRVKLASCGFLENITLARKFYTLYKLCEEQLTKQVHYDFGLRNILSVLRSLGAAKRVNNKDTESTIVMRVLRDMNLSKLIDEDEPLFMSLVADLFPNQVLEKTAYPELEDAINVQVEEAGLVNHPPWQLKLIQLYETQRVRHGIMTLGPAGAGKTTCIQILMRALTQMGEHVWLVLDGPVDSIWIENLNSVLDDNKTLTLANGDRLSMAPTCKIIFEPHNIDNASPATVSRNGMVYMSSSGLNWKPVIKAWLKKRSDKEQEVFHNLFEESFAQVYAWGTQNISLVIDVLQCNITAQMINLLEGLIPNQTEDEVQAIRSEVDIDDDILEETEKIEENKVLTSEHLAKLYVFALIWGMGAYLETANRLKYDVFIRDNLGFLDLPINDSKNQQATLFDYYVSSDGEWTPWTTMVTNYAYPDLATPEYASILIPIPDNVRINYLIDTIVRQEKAVMLTMDMGGFYSLEKPGEFITITDVQFVGAMCQPGGGRNDIPSRLKRQFSIFNCPLPTDMSIDKIFGVIAQGHYNSKRGFTVEVRNLVKKLIPLTRVLWKNTRSKLLPTPAKFHYVFSLRDLSRIWQGMIGTLSNVIESEGCLMMLWKHECSRVFSDRFTIKEDKHWFNEEILSLVEVELGPELRKKTEIEPVFVDFMRDAPEPTGEEGEDADMELPKVYEPVFNENELRDRLDMFLSQYNEMVRGSGMDLVFFPDAMLHLVKISRIIRHPRGNVMLVGVGGSGKQSLTKLSSFIAGYKTFQIALTRSYNITNFLEDLKTLYRSCGCQGKGTTFIFTDLDIKEEGFLEYLNNILSSGVISNLFTKDDQAEIIQELTPIMKRENPKRTLNHETVMEYFMNRTCQNLHVVFCFSPVGEKFRNRALRFPALITGCTIDWFQPWPKDALVSVARHFITDFQIECTKEIKEELVNALGSIQDIVAATSFEYFQRFRRTAHVTPKSYLNFIAGYKSIYSNKKVELSDGALRMDTGLEKLAEASSSVLILKKELANMETELAEASQRAETVLTEVTERAMQAEEVKNQVQTVKEKAEALVSSIAVEKALAEEKLEAAKPALEEAEAALNTIKPAHIGKMLSQMMASTTFLLQLQNYPKDIINNEMVDLLQPYFDMEDYNMDTAKRVCGDVAGLLSWTKAMAFFHSVNREVLPLKANLALQEARLKVTAERQLEERERSLTEVKEQYDKAVMEKQRLTDAANLCMRKMNTATTLINGLGGEKSRWTQQSKDFKKQLGRLVGDALLATGFLSYCGPYNQEFRANLVKTWMDILQLKGIPYTSNLNITNMLVENATVSEWTLQGLPNDELSVQNALIVTKSRSYPLLIDPQNQGKMWIKNKEANNNLQITSLNHKYFRNHLEDCLSLGKPLLIEDIDVELDPVLDNVLEKNFIKSGSIEKVIVGDKECDVLKGFMLYITTKLPNPPYSPEISAKSSIIDFTVTRLGLEDQLLGRVILMEKSDLEAERVALFESVMQNQRKMKELETNLLSRLNSTQGSLVDDEELINVLQVTKATAEEVTQKLSVSVQTEKKINIAREEFRAVASRGSILYFLIVEMSNVNVMYQNSLKQFLILFDNSITKSEKSTDTPERIKIILNLYERHKLLFTLMMAMKIDLYLGVITHEEFMSFIKGGASLDLNAVTPKPFRWILDITWLNLVEISKLEIFSDILKKIESNEKEWRVWYEKEKPEEEDIPCGYQKSLDVFKKLLLIRSWSPDRTLSQARKYIMDSLGAEYGEPCILDLEATWSESETRTPLICILSIGSDPSPQIAALAKSKDIPLKAVSMGQGQEVVAKDMIESSMAMGGWVLLQNIHLSLPFASELMAMIVDAGHIHDSFRIWLTTEMAIKFTNEPPQGIRASLKRTYHSITQDFLDYSSQPQWPPLLYAVAFLHTVVQERRKFGPLGWNIPYEFNQADFAASVQFIQNHLDEMDPKKGVSWPTVCYMLGEVMYGGRVTDDFDKRLLITFTQVWFCDVLLRPGFEFYKNYKVPQTRNLCGYIDYINALPAADNPEVFGLHANADITYQINSAKAILDTILNVQPKEGGGGGGETRESVVHCLAEDMLEKLPEPYNNFEVKEALQRMGPLQPMNIFLRQEIDRIQKVIKEVKSTLSDLKLAIDGTIVMSQNLRTSLDAMYDARIPERWLKEVTRAHKGWALDSVVLQNLITRYNKEDMKEPPAEGVYVHGLFLEGAGLDRKSGKLIESKAKVLCLSNQLTYSYRQGRDLT
nr:unnamed protein product [Callosobruchus analis]